MHQKAFQDFWDRTQVLLDFERFWESMKLTDFVRQERNTPF